MGGVGAGRAAARALAAGSSEQRGRWRGSYRLPGVRRPAAGRVLEEAQAQAGWASRHLLACSGGLGQLTGLPTALALFGSRIFSKEKKKKKKARPVSVFNLVTQVPRWRAGTAPAQEDEGGLPAGLFPHLWLGGLKRACGWVQSRGVVG